VTPFVLLGLAVNSTKKDNSFRFGSELSLFVLFLAICLLILARNTLTNLGQDDAATCK